jgi:hypothetical protein
LLATVGALLLLPAAQAFANGTVIVSIEGTGSGEVSSSEGAAKFGAPGAYVGTPAIECPYSGGKQSGICENEMDAVEEEGIEGTGVTEYPAAGSEFAGWTIEGGSFSFNYEFYCGGGAPDFCFAGALYGEELIEEVTAVFCLEGQTEKECLGAPKGPTNRRTLTITKSAGGTGGIGSVSSKPKGINCGAACSSAVASMYKNTPVTLTAKPSLGSTFTKWENAKEGGTCDGSASTTCTVPMAEAESLEAVFGGTSKAILNPQALTLSKGESSGYGTVKGSGLACEAECSETTVLYQGPTGVAPKNKPGKTVELKATAAFGSEFSGWSGSGCSGTGTCLVTMEEAKTVTATFTAKPLASLTVNKAGSGTGGVSSKPKAINCGTTCTTQSATVPEGEAIVLKEKPGTEMTFTGWSGGGCSGTAETCTVSLSEATSVTATFSGSPKAILNAQKLTLTKAGSGYGTVKAAGLTCEVLCTSTVSLYQGPTGVAPKNKPGKTVVLKALSAPGSKTVEWTGCLSNPTPTECSVTMEAAVGVTATFNEIE